MKAAIRNSDGMALVITLLVVALITAMVVEFSYGVYINTGALYNWQNSQKLSLAAKSATKLAAKLISDQTSLRSYTYPGILELSQKIPSEDLDGMIGIRIEDENSKFNLNTLGGFSVVFGSDKDKDPYNSLVRLLKALDLKTDIADRISYWIDSSTDHRPPYGQVATKDGKLGSVDELLLIPGIDQGTYEKLRPYVTIYGNNSININGASIPVLMSLSSSITEDLATRIVSYRENTPFEKTSDILKVAGFDKIGQFPLGYITVKGSTFYVTATATSGGISRIVESVFELSGNIRYVRFWREI
ncbi:MAG: type II secretion system minor pseudopilin GspK [Nitrospirae bacterium]|nr:type II secretion system minor pseudopilin GspK [Nitrospirota bacterium]